jgi:hypothetical protein
MQGIPGDWQTPFFRSLARVAFLIRVSSIPLAAGDSSRGIAFSIILRISGETLVTPRTKFR